MAIGFAMFRLIAVVVSALLFSSLAVAKPAAPEAAIGRAFSDAIIKRYSPTIDAMGQDGWDHSNSIILHGIEKTYRKTHNKKYLNYIKAYADSFINKDGSIKGLTPALDGMHPGVLCLFLYEQTGDEKYKLAATTMRDHLLGTPTKPSVFNKTPDGAFWHKNNDKYKNVISVDGLYMYAPFLIRYGVMFNDAEAVDITTQQILLVSSHSFNIKANLPYHAWNYDKSKPWAHVITGSSTQFWSRAVGWFSMSLADVLEFLPAEHPNRAKILWLYQNLAKGIQAAQNPADGFWYQVLDAYNQPNNYPEASGTGMMIYGLQKGVDLKLLDASYHAVAATAWQALKTKITTHKDGGPRMNSIAPPMGSQVDYEAYVAIRPVSVPAEAGEDAPHGYIGILMAAAVME
jgi:unsaturated rhamnogalacturonyl hydrolase